ncbi:MFS transporter [Ktedonosporobacter rubrisoli]|uniref:MFS transporter n=1 Tax=Ktedonosporobacter rubrisoli TaxID=2509675 RepID=UPI001A915657|nr:MFS transporter [Ktedonosporobacter rubrisoli]
MWNTEKRRTSDTRLTHYLCGFSDIGGAALGDRFGRRRLFVIGLGLFVAASPACALSSTIGFLIAARAPGGLCSPDAALALTLLSAAFAPEERGRALGIYGSVT